MKWLSRGHLGAILAPRADKTASGPRKVTQMPVFWVPKSRENRPKIGRKSDEKSDTSFSSIWDAILMIFGAKIVPSWKKKHSKI
jgi:hypothetical protein